MKKAFKHAADRNATWRQENLPDPARLADKRILTRETLDWMEAKAPSNPALEHRIDDTGLRAEVSRLSEDAHRAWINTLRADFRGRSDKARRDFGTAHDYRAPESRSLNQSKNDKERSR